MIDRRQRYRQIAAISKYRRLYTYLRDLTAQEWRTSFSEIEEILGFELLPASARLYRPWWANQGGGSGHSQALSWSVAVWETAAADMDAEMLLLRRKPAETSGRPMLDDLWPVHRAGSWPADLYLSRGSIYDDRM